MKLGINKALAHDTPEQWGQRHQALGLTAVTFPAKHNAPIETIDAYVKVCKDYGFTIAEVGAWKNLFAPDEKTRAENYAYVKGQLELAEYIGAKCCVNISGAKGEIWDGAYPDNYSQKTYDEIIETVRSLIDSVKPKKTFYTLEPMPWMHPDSPEDYLQMIKDIDREAFAVHLDVVNMISNPHIYLFNAEFTNHCIDLLGPYIKSCHIKDMLLDRHLTVIMQETPCGTGGFDLKNYIDRINRLDPDMPMIIEHLKEEQAYIDAVQYIKSLMA